MSIRSKLFKFKPLDRHAIDCLVRRRLFLAPWTDLNDAHEAQMFIRGSGVNYHMNPAKLKQLLPHLLSCDATQARVCSLSRVWWSNLLWSHYADCHRGVAIGISLPDDLGGVERFVVQYDDEVPALDPPVGRAGVVEALQHKAREWSYEEENRLLSFDEKLTFVDQVEILDVIFGLRASEEDISLVRHLLPKTVSLWRICRKPGSYLLNAEDIV